MARQIMLDTGPLGMITHPRPNPAIADWFKKLLQAGVSLFWLHRLPSYQTAARLL